MSVSIKLTTKQINIALAIGLFFITVVSRIPVLRAVGETWDEETAAVQIGERYLGNIKRLDFSKAAWDIGAEHPPLARYFYGAARLIPKAIPAISSWDSEYNKDKEYTIPRFLSAILGGLTVVLLFLTGKYLFNRRVGVITALILLTFPAFIAYTSTSSLESVFVFMTTLFVWAFIHALKTGSVNWHLLAVVTLTLSFLTRYNGLFFVVFYAAVIVFRYRQELLMRRLRYIPWPILLSPIIFIGLTYSLWPWLWLNPLRILESISRTPVFVNNEYFFGKIGPMPWFYYIVYFLATTPEILIVLLATFITISIKNYKLKITNYKLLIAFAWFLTPFIATFVSFKQDGVRYVIAFAPALALITGYMVVWIFGYLKTRLLKTIFVTIIIVGLTYPAVLFFPYYLDYFNLASGGPKAAYENNRFDVGWWGEGGLAAVRYINQNLPSKATIKVAFLPFHVLPKFRNDLVLIREDNTKADYILVNDFSQNYGEAVDLRNYKVLFEESTPQLLPFRAPLVQVLKALDNPKPLSPN